MKAVYFRSLLFVACAGLLCAATLSHLPTALAEQKKVGQDQTGKNCERIEGKDKSTFGKCESVCKDKEITGKDVENNRYVCKASKAVSRSDRAPLADQTLAPASDPTPKPKLPTNRVVGKAKKK
jgi:hypothetical protein